MQRENVMLIVSAMSADAVGKVVTSIENIFKVFVNVKMPPDIGPEIVSHIFSLMDRMMQTALGPVLRDERAAQVLRFVAQAARHMQTQFGFAPSWTRDIEELLYRICVNEGVLPSMHAQVSPHTTPVRGWGPQQPPLLSGPGPGRIAHRTAAFAWFTTACEGRAAVRPRIACRVWLCRGQVSSDTGG